jgi:hypothetical protein
VRLRGQTTGGTRIPSRDIAQDRPATRMASDGKTWSFHVAEASPRNSRGVDE